MPEEIKKSEGVNVGTMNEIFEEVARQQEEDYPFQASVEFAKHIYSWQHYVNETPKEKRAFKIRLIAAGIRSLNEE